MRGEIILRVLEFIGEFTGATIDFFDVLISSGYGASHRKLQCEFFKRQDERYKRLTEKEFQRKLKQKYYNLIYKLKRDGLIKEDFKNDSKRLFLLTSKGRDKLRLLKEGLSAKLPKISYKKEANNKFVIVIFDIPERNRGKRTWLRAALRNLGFQMIQKSVWIGKIKIPKEFLEDLNKLNLVSFVEIFEISKTGSLEHVL
jgi:CRISPR/Cas system-associated endoribonuclease Cas2